MKYILAKANEVKPDTITLVILFLFVCIVLKPLLKRTVNRTVNGTVRNLSNHNHQVPMYHSHLHTHPNVNREHFGTFYPLPYAMHKNTEDYYPKNSSLLFSNNKCCKSCCKNLWPLPFDVDDCPTCKNGNEKYVLSNYTCQGENGSGCVCVTKNEGDLLDRRGNNKLVGPRVIFPHDGVEPVMMDDVTQQVKEEVTQVEEEQPSISGYQQKGVETFGNLNFSK